MEPIDIFIRIFLLFMTFPATVLLVAAVVLVFNKRQKKQFAKEVPDFEKFAADTGYAYTNNDRHLPQRLAQRYNFFTLKKGGWRWVRHRFEMPFDGGRLALLEYQYINLSERKKTINKYRVILVESEQLPLTHFSVEAKQVHHRLGFANDEIRFDAYPNFSHRVYLRGRDEAVVRDIFSHDLITWFERIPSSSPDVISYLRGNGVRLPYQMEAIPHGFILYAEGKLQVNQFESMRDDARMIYNALALPPIKVLSDT